MTTYDTGNPLGSSDPRDLFDNAQNTDDAVNGEGKTWVDRFGRTRVSMKGVEEAVPDAIAARDVAVSARDSALLAQEGALAAGSIYPDEPTGRSATADGKTFNVQGAGEVAVYQYRRINAGSSELITTFASKAAIDTVTSAVVARYRHVRLNGPVIAWAAKNVVGDKVELGHADADGWLNWRRGMSAEAFAGERAFLGGVEYFGYRTLVPGLILTVSKNGRITKRVSNTEQYDVLQAEVHGARGTALSLGERLSVMLDAKGSLRSGGEGLHRLRQTRMKIGRMEGKLTPSQLVINYIGDSWIYHVNIIAPLVIALRERYGDAAGGYLNTLDATPVRPFPVPGEFTETRSSGWIRVQASSSMPDLGFVFTSTPGEKISFVGSANAAPITSASLIHYADPVGNSVHGTVGGEGVVRYRFNNGAWFSLTLSALVKGPTAIALSGVPVGAGWTLELESVSGECRIGGVNLKSDASGIRLNKLGQSGSAAVQWAAVDEAEWVGGLKLLGAADLNIITLGTNDQPSRTPAQIAADLKTIAARLKLASPASETLIVQPPENHMGRATKMIDIAAAVRSMCVDQRIPYIDLQYYFGDSPSEYAQGGFRDWLADGIHPNLADSGPMISQVILRAICNSI